MEWHTLHELSAKTSYPEASVSSQLRDFRKAHSGAFKVVKRKSDSFWEYKLEL